MKKPSVLVMSPVRVIISYFRGGKVAFSSNKKGVTVVISGMKVVVKMVHI